MKKKILEERISMSFNDLDTIYSDQNLEELINGRIDQRNHSYKDYSGFIPQKKYPKYKIEYSLEWDYGGSHHIEVEVFGIREETDEEFIERQRKARKASAAAKQAAKTGAERAEQLERERYEKLRLKYEKK